MKIPHQRENEAGFTLLEVMAALSVFLIGIVGVLSLFTSGTRLHLQSERMSGALEVVERTILLVEEELPALQGDLEAGIEVQERAVPGVEGYRFGYSIRSTRDETPYVVELQITWLDGGRTQAHRVTRILPAARTWAQEVRRVRRSTDTNRSGS